MIWKALADPTRRTILNLLQNSPLTTGEISERIDDLSRYAVMKHLGILEDAELINTRREGKFRWNYLNATPIQKSYETWLKQLIQISQQSDSSIGTDKKTIMTATFSITQSLPFEPKRVWEVLTVETKSWWPRELLYYKKESLLQLELEIGGRLFERSGPEDGFLWAHIIGFEKEKQLLLKGQLIPALGGPAISFIKFELVKLAKNSSQLDLSCTLLGEFSEKTIQTQQQNWERLIKKNLSEYLAK